MPIDGEVEITLNGKPEILRCSLKGARLLNAAFGTGGMGVVFRRLVDFDMEAYFVIVGAGLNKKPDEVADEVYRNGFPELTKPLSDFVAMLLNGGRWPKEDGEGENRAGEG